MFQLVSKDIYNNKYVYMDEDNNRAVFKRMENGFRGELLFASPRIKADPIDYDITVPSAGSNMNIQYPSGTDITGIKNAASSFAALVQHWIAMTEAVYYINHADPLMEGMTYEEGFKKKQMMLSGFPELSEFAKFGV